MSTVVSTPPAELAPAGAARPGRARLLLRRVIVQAVAVFALLALWQAVCLVFAVPIYVVPAPSDIWQALVANVSILAQNAWPTIVESALGFVVGNLVAVALAVLFVHWRAAERAFMPVALFIRTIPIVAISPMLVIMLGTGYAPKIVIGALICFFPTLVNMVRGLESVDAQSLELMRVLSASKVETFVKVRIYASLPYLFSALKIATGSCVIGAIVAEWVGASKGLGYLIIQSTYNFTTPLLYATMAVASLVAIAFYALVGLLEKVTVTWQPPSVP
jgi:NitT/TauT family transport system permease protein